MSEQDPGTTMDAIYERYAGVRVLQELAAGRPPVRGSGPPDSPFMVVGEAPGEQEEKLGMPFVGPAGRLLRKLFADAGIPWHLCYITNAVAWRPPDNRTPYPYQVDASRARLSEEVAVAPREVIVAAGRVAWRCLTDGGKFPSFAEARFRWHALNGIRLLAIPHPSYILRLKHDREAWELMTADALRQSLVPA